MVRINTEEIIERYERLRQQLKDLESQELAFSDEATKLDGELMDIEQALPEGYVHPADRVWEELPGGEN